MEIIGGGTLGTGGVGKWEARNLERELKEAGTVVDEGRISSRLSLPINLMEVGFRGGSEVEWAEGCRK